MAETTDDAATDEVAYNGSATELFLAIEEMEWRDAFGIITSEPKQVKTWVKNTTPDDAAALNSWRRLPIHEACIRRAPAWLVSELLSAYPGSSSQATNRGELPLHLAVDKACAPEVVNLIIVANWEAIVAEDQAGRTPLDILDHTELLEIEANKVVFESLQRCHKTFLELQRVAREEKAALMRKEKVKSNAVSTKHQKEMKTEQLKFAKSKQDVEKLKIETDAVRELAREKDHEIQKHILAKTRYTETIRDLKAKEAVLHRQLESERTEIKLLLFKVEEREEEIRRKNNKIDMLSKDLTSILVSNETDVVASLMEAEQSVRTMVSSQIALQKLLSSKSEGLQTLLGQRGIAIPDVRKPVDDAREEKSDSESLEDPHDLHDAAASDAMMAAATAALQST